MKLRDVLDAANAVVDSADNTGCTEDLTVASQEAMERLEGLLGDFREFVETWERMSGVEND